MSPYTPFTPRLRSFGESILSQLRRHEFKYTPLALHETSLAEARSSARPRRVAWLTGFIASLLALSVYIVVLAARKTGNQTQSQPSSQDPFENDGEIHPILHLVNLADAQLSSLLSRQSKTLVMATNEYERRYSMSPPPNFDRWYEFAIRHDTQLIDEYDEVHETLNLFWGMEPRLIRQRVREALGHDNSLMGVTIRNGQVRTVGPGQDDFQVTATQEMLSKFSQWLPDMDLAFNVNDEPRVLVPHEDVSRLLVLASSSKKALRPTTPHFSKPDDLGEGESFEPVQESRFNRLDHQQTFAHARMSCSPDSPSRSLDSKPIDARVGLSFDGISFVDNVTAFSDICLTPSVQHLLGLLNKPNVFAISHDLLPIFTPSKLSTFHDILYPSPYYYAERTRYDASHSVPWNEKEPKLYWRGATSGGYSEDGSWRSLLRQSILSKLRSGGETHILVREKTNSHDGGFRWSAQSIDRATVEHRYDTQFTEIKQCTPTDCTAMRKFFGSNAHAPQEDSWKNRYLLDMDGNALSGRFYALLESFSLPLKVAYFREWHTSRIIPWKHYVPISSTTDEYDEILRFFEEEDDGRDVAQTLALQGRDWVRKAARKEDMEVYMFRLLLEERFPICETNSKQGMQE